MGKTQDPNSIPWNPDNTSFPSRKDLPRIPGAPEGCAWVWGKEDYLGRLNLLTPTRVKAAAAEIKTGEMVRLDLPLNIPEQPSFHRETFTHRIKALVENIAYDDIYTLNTQSGTQWDGFRHVAHVPTTTFYNNTKASDFTGEKDNLKCSIHHWSDHGFTGRAFLLDYRTYATSQGKTYDSGTPHAISLSELKACGQSQGLNILPESQGGHVKPGDILLVRAGWTEDYYARSKEENAKLALRDPPSWAGLEQSQEMLDWLHDAYFAAVAADTPSFERWPSPESYMMHESFLALWGMPIGEMLDLERCAEMARREGRWTFFFTSAPARCVGGVSSHVNGTAIF